MSERDAVAAQATPGMRAYAYEMAVGALTTFATDYAIGKVAESYDGTDRTLDPARIRELFAGELERGKALFSRYQGDITQRASTTNLGEQTRQLRM